MTEAEFLIKKALDVFNPQFGKDFTVDECLISTYPTRQRYDRSYQIETVREDDFVRMHLHLNFSDRDHLSEFTMELDTEILVDQSGDELFVAYGTIDRYWLEQKKYKFTQIVNNTSVLGVLLMEEGPPIVLEDGTYIIPEGQT